MAECWPLRRPCFRPSVSCEAGNDVLSSLATIVHARRGGASVSQRIVAACSSSRRLAAVADRQFSLFSATLGLVERPDAAGEKRAALSGIVSHDNNPAAWIGCRGHHRNRSWPAHRGIPAVQPSLLPASVISDVYSPPAVPPLADSF